MPLARRNIFFIFANLIQIVLILLDRRQVQLSEEEQRLYELVFADVFSPQEFRKLTKSAQRATRHYGRNQLSSLHTGRHASDNEDCAHRAVRPVC